MEASSRPKALEKAGGKGCRPPIPLGSPVQVPDFYAVLPEGQGSEAGLHGRALFQSGAHATGVGEEATYGELGTRKADVNARSGQWISFPDNNKLQDMETPPSAPS